MQDRNILMIEDHTNMRNGPIEKDSRDTKFDARPPRVKTLDEAFDLEPEEEPIVSIPKLEKAMEPRLPKLANLLGELTYGEMLHFAVEATTGKIVETIDPMTASPEAHLLAKQLHAWLIQRRT